MATKKKSSESQGQQPRSTSEPEGKHGERLDEELIDLEVSDRSMKGEKAIDESEVQDAFEDSDSESESKKEK